MRHAAIAGLRHVCRAYRGKRRVVAVCKRLNASLLDYMGGAMNTTIMFAVLLLGAAGLVAPQLPEVDGTLAQPSMQRGSPEQGERKPVDINIATIEQRCRRFRESGRRWQGESSIFVPNMGRSRRWMIF